MLHAIAFAAAQWTLKAHAHALLRFNRGNNSTASFGKWNFEIARNDFQWKNCEGQKKAVERREKPWLRPFDFMEFFRHWCCFFFAAFANRRFCRRTLSVERIHKCTIFWTQKKVINWRTHRHRSTNEAVVSIPIGQICTYFAEIQKIRTDIVVVELVVKWRLNCFENKTTLWFRFYVSVHLKNILCTNETWTWTFMTQTDTQLMLQMISSTRSLHFSEQNTFDSDNKVFWDRLRRRQKRNEEENVIENKTIVCRSASRRNKVIYQLQTMSCQST